MVDVKAEPSTEYVYGDVPPVTAPRVMVPLAAAQVALVVVTARSEGPLELPTVAEVVNVQPLASFTSTE